MHAICVWKAREKSVGNALEMRKTVMKYRLITYISVFCVLLLRALPAFAAPRNETPYLCELGVMAGCGYYVGDATPHIFNDPREAFGAQFRYKFTPRWSLQVKGMGHRITGNVVDMNGIRQETKWENKMINLDAVAEFNFFRFGGRSYNNRAFMMTPYIFAGVGMSLYGEHFATAGAYIPLGLGFKCKIGKFVGLNIAWQHNIYFADNLEGVESLNNTYGLNGWNIMNNDATAQLTFGIVFEFAHAKKNCRFCEGN